MLAAPLLYLGTTFPTVPQTARVLTVRATRGLPAAGAQRYLAFDELTAAAFPTHDYVFNWDNLNLPDGERSNYRARILAAGWAVLCLPAIGSGTPFVSLQLDKINVSDAGAEVGNPSSLGAVFGYKQQASIPMGPVVRIDGAPLSIVLPTPGEESLCTLRYPERILGKITQSGPATFPAETKCELALTLAIFRESEAQ